MKLLARVTLVAPLMLGAFAVDASAQPKPPIAGRMPGGPMQPAFTPVSQSFASVSVDNLRKTGDVATTGSLDGVPLLSGFRTRFMNGDHKLAHVGVLAASSTSAKVTFSDQNGDDPFRATATWSVLKGGSAVRKQVKGIGVGRYELPLEARPANHRAVLTGFEFQRFQPGDQEVRMVGAWIDEAKNVVRVTMMDDSQATQNMAARLGNSGIASAGGVVPEPRSSNPALYNASVGAVQGMSVAFLATVQYAFVPNGVFEGDEYLTGTGRSPSSGKVIPARGVLQGFEFLFEQKHHHLLDIGLQTATSASRAGSLTLPAGESIAFQDNNRDDALRWALKFVNVRADVSISAAR